jgi:predicted FMN-binding regulatory protein PaiB
LAERRLAPLISVDHGRPVIGHVPLKFESACGARAGRLLGHLTRANPHAELGLAQQ